MAFYGVGDNKLTGAGEPQRLSGVPVSQNFFSVLGVQAVARADVQRRGVPLQWTEGGDAWLRLLA